MPESIFENFISKLTKKNIEIGKDNYNRPYFSISLFEKLFYFWIDKPGVNESYFKQIIDSQLIIKDAYLSTYSSFFTAKLYFSGKIGEKNIIASIKEANITESKSAYLLVLEEKK